MRDKTVLCSGAAGFIGSNLAERLTSLGCNVVIVDNLSTGKLSNVLSCKEFIQRDINDSLQDIFTDYKFDYVFHLAAHINLRQSVKEPKRDALDNILGSLNLIEHCLRYKVKKIIFSSTGGAIYSESAPLPWTEESLAKPPSPYGLSKLTVERYLDLFKHIRAMDYVALRYSNVYGPKQDSQGEAGVIAIFIEKALKGEDLVIYGTGEQTRDFVFVQSVVDANLLAMKDDLSGIFNVSSNKQYSVNQVAKMILEMTNSKSKIVHVEPVVKEMMHTQLNSEKIIKKGWMQHLSFEDGLMETIKYFKSK